MLLPVDDGLCLGMSDSSVLSESDVVLGGAGLMGAELGEDARGVCVEQDE